MLIKSHTSFQLRSAQKAKEPILSTSQTVDVYNEMFIFNDFKVLQLRLFSDD